MNLKTALRSGSILFCLLLIVSGSIESYPVGAAPTVPAQIFVVNTDLDYEDCNPGNSVCDPGTWDQAHTVCTPVSNICTLRAAIEEANASVGTDEIQFSSVGQPIRPTKALPYITSPVIVNGTDIGHGDSVRLDGGNAPSGTNGLYLWASNCTVRGMTITGFRGDGDYDGFGIAIDGDNNVIESTYLGTNAAGDAGLGNGNGGIVLTGGAEGNRIGGATPAQRNVISGNDGHGVQVGEPGSGGASNNDIIGNYIGVAADGQTALGNGLTGVSVFYATSTGNRIGGTEVGEGNVIAGNGQHGVGLSYEASGTLIRGNFIGTDAGGTLALPNAGVGVMLHEVSNNTVGGLTAGAGNLISGNGLSGVEISALPVLAAQAATVSMEPRSLQRPGLPIGAALVPTAPVPTAPALSNVVQGNIIGLDVTGSNALPNWGSGVTIHNASSNTIGGTTGAARNLISGNYSNGITIQTAGGGIATGNIVQGNFIGTDQAGTVTDPDGISWNGDELGNWGYGIVIADAAANSIGGTVNGAGNLIAGSYNYGLYLLGAQTAGNQVLGNAIGTDFAGDLALGNRQGGVLLSEASDNVVGGVIAYNSGPGIAALAMQSSGDLVLDTITVRDNQGDGIGYVAGIWGDSGNPGVELRGSANTIVDNTGYGIAPSPGHVTITGTPTVIEGNGGWGIHAHGEVNVGDGAMSALRDNGQGGVLGGEGVWLPTGFIVEDNGGPGIVAMGDADLILEDVTVQRNQGDGIGFSATSWGGSLNPGVELRGAANAIVDNTGHGIATSPGHVTITGTHTVIERNGGWGIHAHGEVNVGDGAMSALRDNGQGGVLGGEGVGLPQGFVVEDNGGPGIVAMGDADLILEDVTVQRNQGDGIGFSATSWGGSSTPGVWLQGTENRILGNGGHGIHAQIGNVTITGTGTLVEDNGGWGLRALGQVEIAPGAMSAVRNNMQGGVIGADGVHVPAGFLVEGNGGPGIVAGGTGDLMLENVIVRDNQGDGIGFFATTWSGSGPNPGIWLAGSANEIVNNGGYGLRAQPGNVTVAGTGTTINGNGGWGIHALGVVQVHDGAMIGVWDNGQGGVLGNDGVGLPSDFVVEGNGGPGIVSGGDDTLYLENVIVRNNQGDGIGMLQSSLVLAGKANVIELNAGHGVFARLGDVWLTGSDIRANAGWGIRAEGVDSLRVDRTLIGDNVTGGVLLAGENLEGRDLVVTGNGGDGIAAALAAVNLHSVQMCDNQGAGLTMSDGDLTLWGVDLCRNTAGGVRLSAMGGSSASDIFRSLWLSNGADGIRYETGMAGLHVGESSFVGNTGYGARNLETGVTLQARNNWWGDASGPGGVGPGSGDEVSTNVDYGDWQLRGIPLVNFAEEERVLAARGVTRTTWVRFRHWDYPTDTLTVTLTDASDWLLGAGGVTVTLQGEGAVSSVLGAVRAAAAERTVGGALEVGIFIPAGVTLGATDLVTVVSVSHADPAVAFTGTFEIVAAEVADLHVAQADGGTQHWADRPITYTIAITNNGPDIATGVVLTDTLPASTSLASVHTDQGGCALQSGDVVCTLGAVGVDASVTVTLVVTPSAAGEIANRVYVGAVEHDPAPYNNRDTAYATILAPVSLTSIDLDGPVTWVRHSFATFVAAGAPFTASLPVTYTWQASGQWWPAEVHTVYAVTDTLSLMWPVTGTQVVTVTAVNAYGDVMTETLAVMIVVNQPPVADAGPDRRVTVGEVVKLDGSGSSDSDESLPLRYMWTQVSGTPVVLSTAVISQPTFTAPATPTVLTFTLRVTDVHGLASTFMDAVVITVEAEKAHVYLPLVVRSYDASYVPPTFRYVRRYADDSGGCTTPATACGSIQYAIDVADEGDVVAIAGYANAYTLENPGGDARYTYWQVDYRPKPDGYYGPALVGQVALVDKSLTLRGGYAADFSAHNPAIYKTVLRPGLTGGAGRGVLVAPFTTVTLEDLYILEGDATGQGGVYHTLYGYYDAGGGIYALGISYRRDALTVRGCVIAGNRASTWSYGEGGGVYVESRDGAQLSGNTLYSNTVSTYGDGQGGGLFIRTSDNLRLENNTIISNVGTTYGDFQGGGVGLFGLSNPVVQRNTIAENVGTVDGGQALGGGLYMDGVTGALISGNLIRDNRAGGSAVGAGGGMSFYQSQNIVVRGNTIVGNVAAFAGATAETSAGGGMRVSAGCNSIVLENNVIARNQAPYGGSGLLVVPNSGERLLITLRHNTIADNRVSESRIGETVNPQIGDATDRRLGELASDASWRGQSAFSSAVPQESQGIMTVDTVTLNAVNNIISGHTRGVFELFPGYGTLTFDHTLWYANVTNADATVIRTNDRSGDPAYVAPAENDYHIGANSAARDAGASAGVKTDIDGQSRDTLPDIGADEYMSAQ